MDYKESKAPKSTITQDYNELAAVTGNIYETVAILAKRADQIGEDLKTELHDKLEEFTVASDSLEEIFENKEQIEVSRFYEAMPKPVSIAVEEWKNDQIYFHKPEETQS